MVTSTVALGVRGTGFEADHVFLVQLQFGGVLDGDDALLVGNEARQHVEQGGLAGAGAARDQEVHPAGHGRGEQGGDGFGHRAHRDQIAHRERILGELADGEDRSVE